MSIHGTDELSKDLNKMLEKVKKVSKPRKVDLAELFNEKFMKSYSEFNSFVEFTDASKFDWSTQEKAELIPVNELDEFVKSTSKFTSWDQMFQAAVSGYYAERFEF